MLLAYIPMFLVAGLKDLLDLTLIGSLYGIGTILSLCCAIAIALFSLFTGSSHRAAKAWLQIGGVTIEAFLFGLNFFPWGTAAVYAMYRMDKKARKKKQEEEQKRQQEADDEFDRHTAAAY